MGKLTVNVNLLRKRPTKDAGWDESKHKRDHGRFAKTEGASGPAEAPKKAVSSFSEGIASKFKATSKGNPYKAAPKGTGGHQGEWPSFEVRHNSGDWHHTVTFKPDGSLHTHYINKRYVWQSVKGKKVGYHTKALTPEESAKYPAVHAAIQEHLTGKAPDVDPKAEHGRVAAELKENLKYTDKELREAQAKLAKALPSQKAYHEPYVASVKARQAKLQQQLAEHMANAPQKPAAKPAAPAPKPPVAPSMPIAPPAISTAAPASAPSHPGQPDYMAVAEKLKFDPMSYKSPNVQKYTGNLLKKMEAAKAAPDPVAALNAIHVSKSYAKPFAYKNALLAAYQQGQGAEHAATKTFLKNQT